MKRQRWPYVLLAVLAVFIVADSQSIKPVLFKLKDIKDVSAASPSNDQALVYNSTTGLWTAAGLSEMLGNLGDTTNGVIITGAGSDTISITHDGSDATISTSDGKIIFDTSEAAAPAGIELSDDDTNYVSVLAQEMASDFTLILPAAVAGGANYVLNSAGANATLQFSDPTSIVAAASTTAAGKIEVAIASELNTGTDDTRAVSPDALAGSVFGTKTVILKVMAEATVVTSGDGKMYFTIPVELNGMNLVSVGAHIYTADGAQNMDIDIYNLTQTADMLSTAMRIETSEKDTATSAQPGTIDTSNDDVATGDEIRIDVTTFTGTGAKGLEIRLGFRLP